MGSLNEGYGIIATLVRDETVLVRVFDVEPVRHAGRTTISKSGARVAMADLVAFCDAGGWKVRTISSPQTIASDLAYRRMASAGNSAGHLHPPEIGLLGPRGDLFEEREHRVTTPQSQRVNAHRSRRRGKGPNS